MVIQLTVDNKDAFTGAVVAEGMCMGWCDPTGALIAVIEQEGTPRDAKRDLMLQLLDEGWTVTAETETGEIFLEMWSEGELAA